MASLQEKDYGWYCRFVYAGKRRRFSLGSVSKAEAETKAGQFDDLLMRLVQKLITLPAIVDFMRHDGKPPLVQKNAVEVQKTSIGRIEGCLALGPRILSRSQHSLHRTGSLQEPGLDAGRNVRSVDA
mgnify:FL=1